MITGVTQDGMMILGTWIHKKTNKKIVVRDMFFEDENMIILTTDGELIRGNDFSDNYLQVSSENKDADEIVQNIGKVDPLFEGMEEFATYPSTKDMIDSPRTENKKSANPVLDKLFKDKEIKCEAEVVLPVPKEVLKMARDFMEVSVDEMIDYVVSHIVIDKDYLRDKVEKYINS